MKKIKFLIAGLFSAIALVFACVVGTRVNAATIEFGTVSVSTASYTGDTKTWGFTTNLPGSNTNIAVGSDINGIVSAKDGVNGTKAAVIQIKNSASNGYDTYPGAEFLVPVPSADSTGTVTRTGNASGERFLALGSNNPVALASPMTFNFTSADIETNPTLSNNSNVSGYFLRFIVSGGEAKTYGISVQVKDGTSTYGAADIKYTVTYMDGTTTLKTDNDAVEGSGISYTPKKYGYDFEGWYTEAGLSNKIDTKTYEVTSDVTLYAKWTAWSNTSIGEYTLTNNAIEKIATGIDGNLAANLELAPSNYTALSGVGMTTTNVTLPDETTGQLACFNTNGAVSTTQIGIKFVAPSNGTITAWIGSGGGSQRNIKLSTDGENSIAPKEGSLIVGNLESNRYVPHEVVLK